MVYIGVFVSTAVIPMYVAVNTCSSLYLHLPKCSVSEQSILFMVYTYPRINMNTYSTWIHKAPLNLSNPGETQHSPEQSNTSCFVPRAETAASVSRCVLALGWDELSWCLAGRSRRASPSSAWWGEKKLSWLRWRAGAQHSSLYSWGCLLPPRFLGMLQLVGSPVLFQANDSCITVCQLKTRLCAGRVQPSSVGSRERWILHRERKTCQRMVRCLFLFCGYQFQMGRWVKSKSQIRPAPKLGDLQSKPWLEGMRSALGDSHSSLENEQC